MWLTYALLGVFCWALVNVLDSLLVNNYREQHPVILMWYQSWFSLALLAIIGFFSLPKVSSLFPLLLVSGTIAYLGDFVFLKTLDKVDVSVTNLAWALLATYLSVIGIFFFQEHWTWFQSTGAILILAGLLIIPLGSAIHLPFRDLILLPLLAALYSPFYVMQKYALMNGESFLAVFFWPMVGREIFSFILPWVSGTLRQKLLSSPQGIQRKFLLTNGLVIGVTFAAVFFTEAAFLVGPLSLVSIISNAQPFAVLVLAWIFVRYIPHFSPKEEVSWRSVGTKIVALTLAFLGLICFVVSN